jgi:DNA-binding transcriptional ArsR family regulator
VFRALVVAGKNGMTPGTMADGLAIPPNTLSFHLKELGHAGLVSQERASRNIIYRAAYEHLNALLGYLTENCCQAAKCSVPESAASCC